MSVRTESDDGILTVTIDRPARRNSVDLATARQLFDIFYDFHSEDDLSVAVLTGANGNFCAGADLKVLAEGERDRALVGGAFGPMGPTRLRLGKPVIAAVEGYAVAGGMELALWCDMRVAAEDAVFGVYCRRFGVPLIDLGTIRLPRLIGHSRAMDLILTGRAVKAQEAHAIGLANRLSKPGEALGDARALARQIAAFPQTCMRNDRLSAIEQWDMNEAEALENEMERGLETMRSGETLSGAAAFKAGAGRHGSERG